MRISKEIRIGFIVVVSSALLVYGFSYLKGTDLLKKQRDYYAVYGKIEGLTEDNPVLVNGFKIGKVKEMSLQPHTGEVVVNFIIFDKTVNIPKNSVARITSLDLLGSKGITLEFGNSDVYAQPGDTLNPAIEEDLKTAVDRRIAPLEKKTKQLIASIDSVVTIVQVVLNKDARENLTKSFKSIKRGIQTFETTSMRLDTLVAEQKQKLEHIFANIESISGNIQRHNEELTNIIKNFSSISDTLAKAKLATTVTNANKALEDASEIINKINEGEGTIGMLLNNDTLYTNLSNASRNLDSLVYDLRNNPHKYIHVSLIDFHRSNRKNKRR